MGRIQNSWFFEDGMKTVVTGIWEDDLVINSSLYNYPGLALTTMWRGKTAWGKPDRGKSFIPVESKWFSTARKNFLEPTSCGSQAA